MFCDLVGSTDLSGKLDPEDLRDVVRLYQETAAEVIARYEGHIAQYLGDGLLIYFGWPLAHEDDAKRAIYSGVAIAEAVAGLNTRLAATYGVQLAVRIGIHTGPVVVGEMGGGGRRENLALGETPNIAARIQGLAEPNTVVMSADTQKLTRGYVDYHAHGEQDLKGVAHPMPVYRVLHIRDTPHRLDMAAARELTPLVGRESEVSLLLARWRQAKTGSGQVVLLNAEPGLGKSRMVQALREHLANESYTYLVCRSSPYYQNTALRPMIDLMQRIMRWEHDAAANDKIAKLEQIVSQSRLPAAETMPLMAALLPVALPADRYPPLNRTPQQQRRKTLEALAAMLVAQATDRPVLFIVEDLHWTDPSTLELLELLIQQTATATILILLTCRPEFQVPWGHRSYLTQMALHRLSAGDAEQIVFRVAARATGGKALPSDVARRIVDKTDGVPLFVEEMTKAVLESGAFQEQDGQRQLTSRTTTLSIPATLQDSLMSRLDRLTTAKGVAQLGATIGRQFSYALLQAVSASEERVLQCELERLVEAELIHQRGVIPQATYVFKHALIRDIAYESLLRQTRQAYHRQIAEALEHQFAERAATEPEFLAYHYAEAGLLDCAIDYWHRAGQRAIERLANIEAIEHLYQGLGLIERLPETPERARKELDLLIALGPVLLTSKGYQAPGLEQAYSRAYELSRQLGEIDHHFSAMTGLRRVYNARRELRRAQDFGEQLLSLARDRQDSERLFEAHWALSGPLFYRGQFTLAQSHQQQALLLSENQNPQEQYARYNTVPGIHCLCWSSLTLWPLGYVDQARQQIDQALSLARSLPYPFPLLLALCQAVFLYRWIRDAEALRRANEEMVAMGAEHDMSEFIKIGQWVQEILQIEQGKHKEHIATIEQWGDGSFSGSQRGTWLADMYYKAHQSENGLTALREVETLIKTTDERCIEAEMHRLKGEILLQQSPDYAAEAETSFRRAIETAQAQQAKSWELRAATSLARLWRRQGKDRDAYALLAPVYAWFQEGFDTADLQEAKALLSELS